MRSKIGKLENKKKSYQSYRNIDFEDENISEIKLSNIPKKLSGGRIDLRQWQENMQNKQKCYKIKAFPGKEDDFERYQDIEVESKICKSKDKKSHLVRRK